MEAHRIVSAEEWIAARWAHLRTGTALTRPRDEDNLPWTMACAGAGI